MIEQKIIVDVEHSCDIIDLGKQGEHKARKVIFDLSKLFETYGEGTATIVLKRTEFDSPYAVLIETNEQNEIEWIITNTDTHKAGTGFCEVRYYVGESLAKSTVYKTHVRHSIHSTLTQVKTPMQDIIDKLSEAAKTILDKFSDIVELADKTEKASKDAEVYKEDSFEFSEVSRTYSELAEAYTNHPPIISDHDTWLVWNGKEYIDTGLPTRGEPVDPIIIRAYVEAYLKENPPHVEEIDPTVPEWAKKPNKPSYNVSEITDAVDIETLEDVEATINQNIDRVEEIANSAYDLADEAETIAKGKSRARVFETIQLMEQWIVQHKTELQIGDNFYIVAKDVPDYWWDGTRVQELETQKVDLTNYYNKTQIDAMLLEAGKVKSVNGKTGEVTLSAEDVGALPDTTKIPTKTSDLVNDEDFAKRSELPSVPYKLSQLESDTTHRTVTDTEKATWNAKSNFDGDYNSLSNKPSIPTDYLTEEDLGDVNVVAIGSDTPMGENKQLWIDPNSEDATIVPEIKDDEISEIDTWSSKKISEENSILSESITEIYDVYLDVEPFYYDGYDIDIEKEKEMVGAYLDANGKMQSINNENFVARFYPVTVGKAYRLIGRSNNTTTASVVLAFNRTDTVSFGDSSDEIITTGTTSNTNYDVEFTPTKNGYVIHCGSFLSANAIKCKEIGRYDSGRIHNLEANADKADKLEESAFYDYAKEVQFSIADNLYIGGTTIKTLNNSHIYYVPIKKGDSVRVIYDNYQHYSEAYTAVAFSKSIPVLNGTVIPLVPCTTEKTNIDYTYTSESDGYICVSESVAWRNAELHIFSITKRLKKYDIKPLKIQIFGDSISDNTWGDKKTWVNHIADYLPMYDCTIQNNAIGGKAIGHEGDNQGIWDLVVTNGIAEADADVIVILAGTNDFNGNRTMGTWGDSNKWTEYGSLQAIIEKLTTDTNAKVIFCTAPQRWNSSDQARTEHNEFGEPLNNNGYSLRELVEVHKSICEKYGIDVVDLYKTLGWNRYNVARFTTDGLHPNDTGDLWICRRICSEIKLQLCSE